MTWRESVISIAKIMGSNPVKVKLFSFSGSISNFVTFGCKLVPPPWYNDGEKGGGGRGEVFVVLQYSERFYLC